MTVQDAVKRANAVKPNAFKPKRLTECLNSLEGRIAADVLLLAGPELERIRYGWPEDRETVLLVRPPHDDLYPLWLCAQIDLLNGEYGKYQNSAEVFNAAYGNFVRWFARTYEPAQGYRPGRRRLPDGHI